MSSITEATLIIPISAYYYSELSNAIAIWWGCNILPSNKQSHLCFLVTNQRNEHSLVKNWNLDMIAVYNTEQILGVNYSTRWYIYLQMHSPFGAPPIYLFHLS